MPSSLTEVTEIATALGMLAPCLDLAFEHPPEQLASVPPAVWDRLLALHRSGLQRGSFEAAFENGRAFLAAADGLRGRPPLRIEWKGPHRPPGDDVVPADLRIDHVYLVSCKYLSNVMLNPGPARLFDRLLVGEERSRSNWFHETAPTEFEALYREAVAFGGLAGFPPTATALTRDQQRALKIVLRSRSWPGPLVEPWSDLSIAIAHRSAERWRNAMPTARHRLRLLWRLLRITTATYFVLGTDRSRHLRLRVESAWDWMQKYELRTFEVEPRVAGQPEVAWRARVQRRADRREFVVDGHVEIRWSHGRFLGSPEAKVYLDTPHARVPGYQPLA